MKILRLIALLTIPAISFSQNELKILSWNLHLLPAPVYAKSKKRLRVDSIIKHLTKSDTTIDLLLFQEVFHQGCRKRLIKGLENLYPYHTPVVNPAKGRLFKTNSGLIIFSKTPFVQMKSIRYEECSGSDCMAFKGAQFIHTVWNNVPLFVVNTHLNSQPPRSIALEQTRKIIKELIVPIGNTKVPIILGGDFNINYSDTTNYNALISILGSSNQKHLDLTQSDQPQELESTLDYLFVYHDQLSEHFTLESVHKIQIGPSWRPSDGKKVYGKTVGFSDHHAVIMRLKYIP
ncbi:endonuclease/exonuclease/phosphatase family protein [Parvicella tangerina]|uniref:Sphingomyelinase C n=1 Tax=Parvicella tangerina TaxID=2829795 RepID=A0A916JPC5_9FLAO|nr:endonuclease/exonuclease/phosphatase family protein [Parvicella tangerina]CAG5084416.1 Sphingomyelinase C [Parvicella tangerina]